MTRERHAVYKLLLETRRCDTCLINGGEYHACNYCDSYDHWIPSENYIEELISLAREVPKYCKCNERLEDE